MANAKNRAKLSKSEFLAQLAQTAAALRVKVESECAGFSADPAESAGRRAAVRDAVSGFEFFCKNYFPHYIRHTEPSELHRHLFRRLPEMRACSKSQNDAVAAPRGEAKSTIVSQLWVLYCIVTGQTHYALIVMDSIDQAYPMLEAIKAELEFNPRLMMDFPEICGQGRVWQAGTIVTRNNVKVQVAGSGKKLRGLRHGPWRPDLVVLDDIENDENVQSPEMRDKLESWLTKTVLQLGGPGQKLDVIYIGTVLHYDSVLQRQLRNPLWKTARFRAVLSWPDNMTMWDRWEEILRNNGEDGQVLAEAFYAANRVEMDAGAQVSWSARPLYELMRIRARDGHQAFASEYQNDPAQGDSAPFAGALSFWVNRLREWLFFGAVDPSLGKDSRRADPSAILVGGYNRETGVLDVVEALIKRRLPDLIISDVIELNGIYRCLRWAVETVQFQEWFAEQLAKRAAAAGLHVPVVGVKPHSDKILRITALQPYVRAGLIRLHESQRTLREQLEYFPLADHDDGPDCLEMLWSLATGGRSTPGHIIVPGSASYESAIADQQHAAPGYGRIGRTFDPYAGSRRDWGG